MKFNLKNFLLILFGTIAFLLLLAWLIEYILPILIFIVVFPGWLVAILSGKK